MNAAEWIDYLGLALMLGVAGQLARFTVGMKKLHDKAADDGKKVPFDNRKFWLSIVLGGLAGLLAAVGIWEPDKATLDREFLLMIMAAGYAGSDFVEGIIERGLNKLGNSMTGTGKP